MSPAQDLGFLLEDVISIVRYPQLPFDASKTTILASWIVRTQVLPKSILLPRIDVIFLYLKFILEDSAKDTLVNVTVVDALNVRRPPPHHIMTLTLPIVC
jgi:hypothetical protein